jgi:flagellar hook-associated protein 3 FlgL
MSVVPTSTARVSNQLRAQLAQGHIARTQRGLLQVQTELTTGHRINVSSDDPGDAAIVQQLQKTLEQRGVFLTNLRSAKSRLSEVDSTLSDLTDLVRQAQQIASANVGSDVPPDQRAGAAAIVDTLLNQVLSLANKQFEGSFLFGGDRATEAPFSASGGGVRYNGTGNVLANAFDEGADLPFTVSGADVFGALSTRVHGRTDLAPSLSATTRLADLPVATGNGVRHGKVLLGNGSSTATVDLSAADTVGDVIAAINAAGVGSITASIAPDGNSLRLSAGATDDVTLVEVGGGSIASDLGLLTPTGGGAGVALDGADVKPAVSPLTALASLRGGAGIDLTSGIKVTSGGTTETLTFAGATTVQDLLNAINGAHAGVVARINADTTGIDVLNPVQGTKVTVGENGGTTAADLGVLTFSPSTPQADLNGGTGVRTVAGVDFRVTASDGSTFDVALGSAGTVADVLWVINTAATSAGVAVSASLSGSGGGITLTDSTGGSGTLSVTPQNFSPAAADLGLDEAPVANVIVGRDVGAASPRGLFANLAKLRDALRANDSAGVTAAAEGLTQDDSRVTRIRGETGARVQEMDAREQRLDDQNVATEALLSSLADTDLTEAITRFQTLQTTLQATLQTTARVLDLSLLDFLA